MPQATGVHLRDWLIDDGDSGMHVEGCERGLHKFKMEGGESDELGASFLANDAQYMVESGHVSAHEEEGEKDLPHVLREQDRFLPIANVARIMKKGIPKNGKIAKDARECVQECVSEFISFVTSEASDRCHQEKRKTINGEDILWAMNALGFENYVEPLKIYLQKYREIVAPVYSLRELLRRKSRSYSYSAKDLHKEQ
ncbi:uncharacterized protein LOC143020986 isoform X9 [Oratosquilla oratoria]|uniref:uncharacterized protein LOC143020986 isoform X9 n=1 Tax=Oratosquilla oratoria TaxID=337810 RepID=UPI003F761273